ncbi:SRPBCC family protein [Streptomyces sp. FIT100]|uniref:SRPBCC family protein n=1 Tax=Streptomyces sp. FIT100 TaxID=2837956 RepID=UPI0021C731A4|nr:SRPBCC family protein [Streptomyces sp. FIT100]UUN29759.1 SRPBCC family protein [Streptomyces sp. FIT100]
MELNHSFTVPVPVDDAWRALLDIERVAPCMPGATVEAFDGETITGSVKVKVGPIALTYRGTAVFAEQDEAGHRMVLTAGGKEARGQGTARATVTGTLTAAQDGGGTDVSVRTDLAVTGRPAQFGRGVLADVGDKLVGQFADCLSRKLSTPTPTPTPTPTAESTAALKPTGAVTGTAGGADGAPSAEQPAREAEPIDLVRTAGLPVAERAATAALVAGAAVAVAVLLRRRCRRAGN